MVVVHFADMAGDKPGGKREYAAAMTAIGKGNKAVQGFIGGDFRGNGRFETRATAHGCGHHALHSQAQPQRWLPAGQGLFRHADLSIDRRHRGTAWQHHALEGLKLV